MWQFNYNPNHIKPYYKWSILFILLMSVAQVYPFYHLHHIHSEEKAVPNIGSLDIEANADDIFDHHSEDPNTHANDHGHKFNNHVDWRISRPQSTNSSFSDDEFIEQDGQSLFNPQIIESRVYLFEHLRSSDLQVSSFSIRGPPRLA